MNGMIEWEMHAICPTAGVKYYKTLLCRKRKSRAKAFIVFRYCL